MSRVDSCCVYCDIFELTTGIVVQSDSISSAAKIIGRSESIVSTGIRLHGFYKSPNHIVKRTDNPTSWEDIQAHHKLITARNSYQYKVTTLFPHRKVTKFHTRAEAFSFLGLTLNPRERTLFSKDGFYLSLFHIIQLVHDKRTPEDLLSLLVRVRKPFSGLYVQKYDCSSVLSYKNMKEVFKNHYPKSMGTAKEMDEVRRNIRRSGVHQDPYFKIRISTSLDGLKSATS